MRAAVFAIGDEIILGESMDTNSAWLASELAERGVDVVEHRTLGDDQAQIAAALRELARHCSLIITTGGLGPTADDLTRTALAEAIDPDEPLVRDEAATAHLEAWFERRGRAMPESNTVQAMRPRSASMIPNPRGTAMGLSATLGNCRVLVLPGPPLEMMPMFEEHVAPMLPAVNDDNAFITHFVHAFGISESEAAQRLGDLLRRGRHPQIGITASQSILTMRIRARGPRRRCEDLADRDAEAVRRALAPYVFGDDDSTLSEALGELLRQRDATVTTAESCTGGLLGKLLVDVAGSSDYYVGGWVTYTNELKSRCLGVPAELLASHGAVSAEVARAMAEGAMTAAGTTFALSITGIAGPGGGSHEKPVGTVHIALASRGRGDSIRTTSRRFIFAGDRDAVRLRSAMTALQMLRFTLLGVDAAQPLIWEARDAAQSPGSSP